MEIALKDAVYFAALLVGVVGSHFRNGTRIAVLEERVSGHSKVMKRIEESLLRIEEKIDNKADR